MPKMKALKRFPYFGHGLAIGQTFEASESDAHIFELLGQAERDRGNVAEPVTDHAAEAVAVAIAEPSTPAPQAQNYRTRDMGAAGRRGAKRATQ